MAKWATIDELILTPRISMRQDPVYHTQQFPGFMKRKSILKETYEKAKKNTIFEKNHRFKPKSVDATSPSQWTFQAYGKYFRHKTAKVQEKITKRYDEALDNQEFFIKVSPNSAEFEGDFRASTCPREISPLNTKKVKKSHKSKKTEQVYQHTLSTFKTEGFADYLQSNMLVLLSKNSPKKCQDCWKAKCECQVVDTEIPKSFYENINKGKELLQVIKQEKSKRLPKSTVVKNRKKVVLCDGLMRYTSPLPLITPNKSDRAAAKLLESQYRRYSS